MPIATSLQGNNATIGEKLRELLATKLNRVIERKQDRAGVEAFYRDRGFAPLWISDGKPSDRAKAATAFLRGVGADGLEPSDYPSPAFAGDADKLAQDELALTQSDPDVRAPCAHRPDQLLARERRDLLRAGVSRSR